MPIPRPYPNETADWRAARDELLAAEVALRAQIEQVAALRRQLPTGPPLAEDYAFTQLTEDGPASVALSELFTVGDTLVVYNFMFSPGMKQACPLCTGMLDGLDAQAEHIAQNTDLVVVASSPIERIRAFADARGWSSLRLLSSERTSWQRDYLAQSDKGYPWPMATVFVRRATGIHLFWSSELFYASNPDGDTRHVDQLWPLWNVLDLTPEGRGSFYPRLDYGQP